VEIQIDQHTLERAGERGASKGEIFEVIRTGFPIQAKHGRSGKAKIFPYHQKRGRKFYTQKRIEVIYLYEGNTIITVTGRL
jgi:hypothetical protein